MSRYVDVTADVTSGDVAEVAAGVQQALDRMAFPLEYHAEILGDYDAERSRLMQFLGFATAALLAMFLLFQAFLRSWKLAALAFVGMPPALAGGMLAAAATGAGLGLGTLIGVMVLVGVYSRNLLALFGRYRALFPPDGRRPGVGVVVRGAWERFLPSLASTSALVALLLPVLWLGPGPGLEILHPAAVVVLGGLATTTAMCWFVLPLMYLRTAPHTDTTDVDAVPRRDPARPGVTVG